MSESFNSSERVLFPTGKQKKFIDSALSVLSVSELAQVCGCSTRTLRDWRREKFRISLTALRKICRETKTSLPRPLQIVSAFAHTSDAGKKGGAATMKKYGKVPGTERYRKEQWEKWWSAEGKFKKTDFPNTAKSILKPKPSKELAEFIGIMMGDGGISNYQCTVSLHSVDDEAYARYVVQKIKDLFGVSPSIYTPTKARVRVIVVSRVELVKYLHELGLPIGNKVRQRLDIPIWIKKHWYFARMCVRGLVDTDGSVFTHTYKSKGRSYSYKKLSFTSASPELVRSVAHILYEFGMSPRVSGRDVRLDSIKDMTRYFEVIGSNNPKHLKRWHK
jgi:transcriptional regulator with XRE-family HTH domain